MHPIISHRVKDFDSYLAKLDRLRKSQSRGPLLVRDFLGLRVVCPFLDETERVQQALAESFRVAEVEHKGANRSLAEFGYDSVHVLIRLPDGSLPTLPPHTKPQCEVQVRTILQHAWAQIEHELVYKADRSLPKSAIRRKLAAVSATLTLADLVFQEARDDLAELQEQGDRRRKSAQGMDFDDGIEPLVATPREVSLVARRDRTLPDPKTRNLENRIVDALRAHSAGDLKEAIQLYHDVLRLKLPNRAIRSMIYNHRGIAHLALSRPARALGDFASAVRWNAENSRAHFNLGLAHRALGKPTLALRALRRAAKAQDVEAEARCVIAQILAAQGRRRAARLECDKALALKPDLAALKALKEDLQ
jgi:putative GTP pyrophosphokinase